MQGARDEALCQGAELLEGAGTPLSPTADLAAEREHFLHWPLAFAEVFARERPGFDAVVGNPPWEEVTVEELAFYARYRPGIRALPQREREAAVAKLIEERPELPEWLNTSRERAITLRRYFATESGFEISSGDPDTYKLFFGDIAGSCMEAVRSESSSHAAHSRRRDRRRSARGSSTRRRPSGSTSC